MKTLFAIARDAVLIFFAAMMLCIALMAISELVQVHLL